MKQAFRTTLPVFTPSFRTDLLSPAVMGLVLLAGWLPAAEVAAQDRIFRCGNEYINNTKEAQARGCKPVEGGNLTVVQIPAPARPPVRVVSSSAAGTANPAAPAPRTEARTDSAEQRARDGEARSILEAELKKTEARLVEKQKEYNNGEPERLGIENRNYQRYLDRVNELKDSIARHQSDVAGLKRELARLPASAGP